MTSLTLTPMGLRAFGRVLPCTVGRGGVSVSKREGDGATPAGRHRITALFYRPDRLTAPASWAQPIRPGDLWCDDSAHPAYNRAARWPLAASHEALRRPDPLYDLVLVTDWNMHPAVPGRGSAIFLHQWRRPGFPTAGCIALARHDLIWLAGRAAPGTRLIIPPLPRHPARMARVGRGD